jgi:hypothetical protein
MAALLTDKERIDKHNRFWELYHIKYGDHGPSVSLMDETIDEDISKILLECAQMPNRYDDEDSICGTMICTICGNTGLVEDEDSTDDNLVGWCDHCDKKVPLRMCGCKV